MLKKNYNIGLDIGTDSIGYAVTSINGDLCKVKGRSFWGVRTFEAGKTAAERRTFRSARRRKSRKVKRIKILQDIFSNELNGVDVNFLSKIKESFYLNKEFSLFGDDKDYYKKFPTIYHLRNHLVKSTDKEDIRLVYLAIHHILKYRGNFLYEGQKLDLETIDIRDDINQYLNYIVELENDNLSFTTEDINEYISNLLDIKVSRKDRANFVINNLPKDYSKGFKEFNKAILGNKSNLSVAFFCDEEIKETSVAFSDDYNESEIEELIEDKFEYYLIAKRIFSVLQLRNIRKNEKYISDSMINKYNKFKDDLLILKRFVRVNFSDKYNEIFKQELSKTSNYKSYMDAPGKNSREEFYKYLIKIFNSKMNLISSNEDYIYIIREINMDNFLVRLNVKDNSAIPYQLHLQELKEILKNQSEYYNFIKDNTSNIIMTMEFRIPYYVGPLNPESKFSWVKRLEEGEVLPWNFDQKVDKYASAEQFIKRMTNKCTYLFNEDVLPKKSLLVCEFEMLNELNKVRLNGKSITKDQKSAIINNLFKKKKKVTHKDIINLFKKDGIIVTEVEGTQKEKEFASSLVSYVDMEKIFGFIDENNYDKIEKIISWITIFEDKSILKYKLANDLGLSNEVINQIANLNYSGWSRLSNKLLNGIKSSSTKNNRTIIEVMRKTNLNLMQVLKDYDDTINKENSLIDDLSKFSYEDLDKMNVNPSIKKALWQSILLVEEIMSIMKTEPVNIYIEVTRSEQQKVRTTSRIDSVLKLYQQLENDMNIDNLYKEAKNYKNQYDNIDNERLYLYFTQLGKCMYSGNELSISDLSMYEIDHIIPRTLIKDDSISNKVLVIKKFNQDKGDSPLVPEKIVHAMSDYWRLLYSKGLITYKKYASLTRSFFDERDINGFINRQIVETSQIVKNVATILDQRFKEVNVITVKSQLTSNLRNSLDLFKYRDLNNSHHAFDAYLAIQAGDYLKKEFNATKYSDYFKGNDRFKIKNPKGYTNYIVRNFTQDGFDDNTGELTWNGDDRISMLKKALVYKDHFYSRKTEEQTGLFYNQTILKKKKGSIPIKKGLDPQYYGGYTNDNEAYSVIVKYSKKGKEIYELCPIYIRESVLIKNDVDLNNHLKTIYKDINFEVVRKKINKYQLCEYDGQLTYITSTNELTNAKNLYLNSNMYKNLNIVYQNSMLDNDESRILLDGIINELLEKIKNHFPLFKKVYEAIYKSLEKVYSLDNDLKRDFIKQMLIITAPNAGNGNFKKFDIKGLTEREGRLRKPLKVSNMVFIDTSITGVFQRKTTYGL